MGPSRSRAPETSPKRKSRQERDLEPERCGNSRGRHVIGRSGRLFGRLRRQAESSGKIWVRGSSVLTGSIQYGRGRSRTPARCSDSSRCRSSRISRLAESVGSSVADRHQARINLTARTRQQRWRSRLGNLPDRLWIRVKGTLDPAPPGVAIIAEILAGQLDQSVEHLDILIRIGYYARSVRDWPEVAHPSMPPVS